MSLSSFRRALPGHIHFIGICGRGMSGLAMAISRLGVRVTGSDVEPYGAVLDMLREQGIEVRLGFSSEGLEPAPELVVISRAYGRGNPEVEGVLERRLRYTSFPRFIRDHFLEGARNLVVAGSKGKTTTTAMSAWIMHHAGVDAGYLVAGHSLDLPYDGSFGTHEVNVLEGDDYSTLWYDDNPKFCDYLPYAAILTNIWDDHPEHHSDERSAMRHFECLTLQLPRNGLLVTGDDGPLLARLSAQAPCPVTRVGFDASADVQVEQWRQTSEGSVFNIGGHSIRLPLLGRHNALNAAMSATACRHFGVSMGAVAAALGAFRGVKERLEHLSTACGIDLYTDMGYLPECMASTFAALRQRHAGQRFVLVYQGFAIEGMRSTHGRVVDMLASCDLVLLTDTYKPRLIEGPNPGFADEVAQQLTERKVANVRIGPIEAAMVNAVAHLHPGDLVLCILHPRHRIEVDVLRRRLVELPQ